MPAALLAAGCDGACSGPEAVEGEPTKPNVIVVLVDTLRADHLGYMGAERPTSPALDAFAREAVVFRRHHSHSSRTGPSVASIFTGKYPGAHGVLNPLTHFDAKGKLADSHLTMAEVFEERGYDTLGLITNLNVRARFGFSQGFDDYELLEGPAPRVNERFFEHLDERGGSGPPLFAYLHYMDPHSPYTALPQFRGDFVDDGYEGPIDGSHAQLDRIVAGKLHPDAADRAHLQALYDQEVRSFDHAFGELLEELADRGLKDDTILVFIADHGEELFDHGSVLHGYTLYEEQLHVPFMIRLPGGGDRPRGVTVDATTRHVDVLPTLLDLAGLPEPSEVQGRTMRPFVEGREVEWSTAVFAQVQLRAVKTVKLRSLQHDRWKLIEHDIPERSVELYDLTSDPAEKRNVAGEHPGVVERLQQELAALRASHQEEAEDLVELTDREREQLRALGYGH